MTMRHLWERLQAVTCIAAVVLVITAGGCASEATGELLHPASGQVLFGGSPVAGASVVLYPEEMVSAAADGSRAAVSPFRPNGITDAEGRFKLGTYVQHDGAPAGRWVITLTWPDERIPPAVREEILASGETIPDRFRGRFDSPYRPLGLIEIAAGENQIPAIQIPAQ